MSSALRSFAQAVPRIIGGNAYLYEYDEIVSSNGATINGSLITFANVNDMGSALDDLSAFSNLVQGDRAMNMGKHLYMGIAGKESDIVTFSAVKITYDSNDDNKNGKVLYVLSNVNTYDNSEYQTMVNEITVGQVFGGVQ